MWGAVILSTIFSTVSLEWMVWKNWQATAFPKKNKMNLKQLIFLMTKNLLTQFESFANRWKTSRSETVFSEKQSKKWRSKKLKVPSEIVTCFWKNRKSELKNQIFWIWKDVCDSEILRTMRSAGKNLNRDWINSVFLWFRKFYLKKVKVVYKCHVWIKFRKSQNDVSWLLFCKFFSSILKSNSYTRKSTENIYAEVWKQIFAK